MKLSFHGGAREVTGACYLVESGNAKLLVDCGLFQGSRECEELNFQPFQFDPSAVDALLVTHAHVDHVGRVPKLVRAGFSGAIYSTPATRELAELLLEDALHLAERRNEEWYDSSDLQRAMALWKEVPYRRRIGVGDAAFQFRNAGHILGSAFAEVWAEGKHLLFTGDLGNIPSVLLPPPEVVRDAEYLIIESTYGNRSHEPPEERILKLERAAEDIAARRGVLVIPAFATERTQDILFLLNEMLHFKRIPEMPVFVDSPLAIRATAVYERHTEQYKDEIRSLYLAHPHLFQFKKLRFTQSVEESKQINEVPPPKIIIAGSGMMQGGRILHHLRRNLSDPHSILVVVGYQAGGSLGRRLLDGEKVVKILGEELSVAAEIRKINGFSAHADNPQLFSFVESARDALKRVFVVQGEEAQALHLAQEVKDRLGVQADAPMMHEHFEV